MRYIKYKDYPAWIDAQGHIYELEDMTTEHIQNAIRKIELNPSFRQEWLNILRHELRIRKSLECKKNELMSVTNKVIKEVYLDKDFILERNISDVIVYLQKLMQEYGDAVLSGDYNYGSIDDFLLQIEKDENEEEKESRIELKLDEIRTILQCEYDKNIALIEERDEYLSKVNELNQQIK